jgi:hypothetical protein
MAWLRVAVDEAKKLGREVWILDGWMCPNGIAGGRIVKSNPEFANHVIPIARQRQKAPRQWI